MTKEELAKWLHDNYEAIAKEQNWVTQQRCKVEFDALPDANKRTMIEIADRLLNFNLLRLHFVVGRSEQLSCENCKLSYTPCYGLVKKLLYKFKIKNIWKTI